MNGETKTYLYPKTMRSEDGWGNFFVVRMVSLSNPKASGSKWLGYKTKTDAQRILISDEAYEALVKNAKENRKRFGDKESKTNV